MFRVRWLAAFLAMLTVLSYVNTASAMFHTGMGRFLQRDSLGELGHSVFRDPIIQTSTAKFAPRDRYADGMNLYQYVGSNPARFVDPSGNLKICDLIAACESRSAQNSPQANSEPVLNQLLNEVGQRRAACNKALDAKVVAYAVNHALIKLGFGSLGIGAGVGSVDKAAFSTVGGNTLWFSSTFGGTLTTSGAGGAKETDLGDGWVLKLYKNASGGYESAVLPQTIGPSHVWDWLWWSPGSDINGNRAEQWLGKYVYDDVYNDNKLRCCPDLLRRWMSAAQISVTGYAPTERP